MAGNVTKKGTYRQKGGKFEKTSIRQPASKSSTSSDRDRNRTSRQASKSTRQGSNLRPGDLQSLAPPLSYWWLDNMGGKFYFYKNHHAPPPGSQSTYPVLDHIFGHKVGSLPAC